MSTIPELQKIYVASFKDSPLAKEPSKEYSKAAEQKIPYTDNYDSPLTSALILHDVDTKTIRKDHQTSFKQVEIDLLVVFNMLLTGFDAPRLKKLYLLRIIESHNLLQTLTRVNRPFKTMRHGFVVDFADIRKEFDKTNKQYFKELQQEYGDDYINYSNLFKPPDEIESEIAAIREKLFLYDFSNIENFQKVVSQITDKKEIYDLRTTLDNLKSLYNIIKTLGYTDLLDKFNFDIINKLYNEVSNRINIINLKETLDNASDNTSLLNMAMSSIQFTFKKISEHELQIADKFMEEYERTRKALEGSLDRKDPVFISLLEELNRLFKKKNIEELTSEEMNLAIKNLENIYKRVQTLNNRDTLLAAKYENDSKFARIHKRIRENKWNVLTSDIALNEVLLNIKHSIDNIIINNHSILDNEAYFEEKTKRTILEALEEKNIKDLDIIHFINKTLVNEYFYERAA